MPPFRTSTAPIHRTPTIDPKTSMMTESVRKARDADLIDGGTERALDLFAEPLALYVFVDKGLDGADLVDAFVGGGADHGNAVLGLTRQPPDAATKDHEG